MALSNQKIMSYLAKKKESDQVSLHHTQKRDSPIRVSKHLQICWVSVCSSVGFYSGGENRTDLKLLTCRHVNKLDFFQHVVGLVYNFIKALPMGIWTLYLSQVWYYPDRPVPLQGNIDRISNNKRDNRPKKKTTDEQTDMQSWDRKRQTWQICEWQICSPRNWKINRWADRQSTDSQMLGHPIVKPL